jgi:hypothetical protein
MNTDPRKIARQGALGLLLGLSLTVAASAQETRTSQIEQEQAQKSQQLRRYEPNKAERVIEFLHDWLIDQPSGFYPTFDSIYSGGGFTLGGVYRSYYGDETRAEIRALYSIKNYKLFEVSTTSPGHFGDRLDLGLFGGWRDATQVNYYGLGMDTTPLDRSTFRFQQAYGGASARLEPVSFLVLNSRVTYEDYTPTRGMGPFPSIEEVFTPETAPGLGVDPVFLHSEVGLGIDSRLSPDYARSGGHYGVVLHDYLDLDDAWSFRRLDGNAIQHIPILRETWVLSLRGQVQTTLRDSDQVPYFLLPSLGSGETLRAYPSFRFRDRHSMLLSAEWRWIPNRYGMDMAIFYDAGKVTPRREDLDFSSLKHNWGIGVRFHAPLATVLRFDVARGSEGWHLVVSGSAPF